MTSKIIALDANMEQVDVMSKNVSNLQSNQTSYIPAKTVVVLGINSTVQWYNQGGNPSRITSDWGKFDSGLVAPNHSWTYVFERPGVYGYHGEPSPLHGKVIVLPN